MKDLPSKVKLYLICVITLLIILFINSFNYFGKSIEFPVHHFIFFAVIATFAESFNVIYNDISISPGFAFTLAAVLVFNPFYGAIIIILGSILRVCKKNGEYVHVLNTPYYKTLFNISNFGISILLSSFTFRLFGLTSFDFTLNMFQILTIVVSFTFLFLVINTFIISLLFSLLSNSDLKDFYIKNLKMGLLNIVAMAPFGVILAITLKQFGLIGVFLLVFPILLSRYTFTLYLQVKNKYIVTVQALMHAIEARDKYTEGHSRRVADIVELIAKELKFRDNHIEQLKIASLLHDVGKIGIDNNILNKPGKLTNEEYAKIKDHPEIGYNILKDIKELEDIAFIVRHHHERYDGNGYPLRKRPNELNLDVYIVQLADSIDAMATNRPYREALTEEMIIDEIISYRGTQFHPTIVDAYINALKKK